ncbi:MAG: hypothetical protein AAF907_02805 [Planctomycetota bacterium]
MLVAPLVFACLLVPQPDEPPEAPAPLAGAALERAAEAALERALDAPLAKSVDIKMGTTLDVAVKQLLPDQTVLADTGQLEILGLALEELRVAYDVKLPAGRFPVRRACEVLLDQTLEEPMALLNEGGTLYITTQDTADERLYTRVYNVRDLLESAAPAYRPFRPMSQDATEAQRRFTLQERMAAPVAVLEEAIISTTGGRDDGGPWEEISGEGGTIEEFHGVLTIRQTYAVHRQIKTLLTDLRTAFKEQPWTFDEEPNQEAGDGISAAQKTDHAAQEHDHGDGGQPGGTP